MVYEHLHVVLTLRIDYDSKTVGKIKIVLMAIYDQSYLLIPQL